MTHLTDWTQFLSIDTLDVLETHRANEREPLYTALDRFSTSLLDDIYDAISNCGLVDTDAFDTPRNAYRAYLINASPDLFLADDDTADYSISMEYPLSDVITDRKLISRHSALTAVIEYCAEQTELRYN